MTATAKKAAKVILAGVHLKHKDLVDTQESMAELRALALTLDLHIVAEMVQQKDHLDSRSFLGKGKLEELTALAQETEAEILIIDGELSPNQAKVIEQTLEIMVLDRSQLILEIFSEHARTPESRDQVELARLHYMLPRLVGMWAHLDREAGGIGLSRGMGEKQINIDRTLTRNRIAKLEKDLARVESQRATQGKRRQLQFTVALVGYTNAGKSTLLKGITGKGEGGENKLFATLESTTRKLTGVTKPEILLSDTVGFIQNLPHHLIASFRSTLSVVREADLLLQVVDASSPIRAQQIETTEAALKEIGANEIPRLMVMNKIDLLTDPVEEIILKKTFPKALLVSSLDPKSLDELKERIAEFFKQDMRAEQLRLSLDQAKHLPQIYQLCMVEEVQYEEDVIILTIHATPAHWGMVQKLLEES